MCQSCSARHCTPTSTRSTTSCVATRLSTTVFAAFGPTAWTLGSDRLVVCRTIVRSALFAIHPAVTQIPIRTKSRIANQVLAHDYDDKRTETRTRQK
jgi:hypothetical protein